MKTKNQPCWQKLWPEFQILSENYVAFVPSKGGSISKGFSLWLKSQKECQITPPEHVLFKIQKGQIVGPKVQLCIVWGHSITINYTDKKRGVGGQQKVNWGSYDKEQIVCKMSMFVHSRGKGVKNGQNLVHIVVECPLIALSCSIKILCRDRGLRRPRICTY